MIASLMGGTIGLKIGKRIFANPKVERNLKQVRLLIKELKSMRKIERKTIKV